jgi:sugar/nucleoside kinase (ribokinase family)
MLSVQSPPALPRRLLFAGEAIVDVTMRVPAFPAPGADVLADSSRITAGGGFNVMAAAARQGLPVLYAGAHGTGPWGDLVRKAMAAEGIEVLRDPDPLRDTGFAIALGKPDDTRTYVTRLGAESVREPGSMDQVTAGPGDAVYISGYGLIPPGSGPVVAEWAADLPPGALLFLDPGPLVPQIPAALLDQVLPRCDWLSCTAAEATLLTGIADPVDAAAELPGRTRNAIIRSGSSGCFLAVPPAPPVVHVPAPAVPAVDTTGAGDAHAGAFLAALAAGLSPEAAARRANAAAALAVTRPGPATAPTRAELDAWLSPGR